MYDLNFFAAPVKTAKRSMAGIIGVLVIVLVVGAVAAFYFLMEMRANVVRVDVDNMKAYLASDTVKTQLAALEITKQKQQLLKDYHTAFGIIDKYVGGSKVVVGSLLNRINATIPAAVTFRTYSISGKEILIEAVATDNLPMAELIFNLKQTGLFSTVELQNITIDPKLKTEQIFTVRCALKEVTAR